EGGMGRVYLAEHIDIGKRVAVKILHPVYGRMPDLVERFRREARAASRIGHPHIVDVTDSGTTADGSVYFVMEYLDGVELASVIDREGALDITRALRLVAQICRALAAAHAAGIIHRDLKPENVYLTHRHGMSDFVKVLDFGIAKSTEAEQARDKRLTSPGMAMGTPEYMSPEQAAGRPADERCDIYSLGAILYEALTGVPPYEGENFMEILTKKATVDPRPCGELRPELPEVIEDLVQRSMARNPDERPPSMEAFEFELTKCLAGRGAAVARILGLQADAALISGLNPGLNVVLEERGVAHPARDRRVTPRGRKPHSVPDVAPGRAETASRAPNPAGPQFAELDDTAAIVPVSSSIGLFGWIVLVAMVFTGIGVVLFVATGERGGRTGDLTNPNSAVPGLDPQPSGAAAPDAAPADPVEGAAPDRAKAGAPDTAPVPKPTVVVDPNRSKPKVDSDDSKRPKPEVSTSGAPRTKREASRLLKDASKQKSRLQWDEARASYQRVASGKHLRSSGYLGLAKVAFETKDTEGAIQHATKALELGATSDAWMILGHGYYKQGRYREALEYYDKVLARSPGNKEAQSSAALARKKLGR
ncbi:MAG TPA: serine/threonine-protein kinase, partial [Kofleriaceae bacterium]|nr:serine/threonine-protein kinase [Kofleriaceae bacterium]